jgi:hypothetical protein
MSERSRQAMETATAVLAVIIVLSATVRAGDPNTPPADKAKTKKVAKPSPSRPSTPAKPSPASFTREMSFGEAMDILRNSTTPPLNIVVLWKEIGENAGVYRETSIGIDGVAGLRAGQYLELLLLSLSGSAAAKLGYTVKDSVITVGTTDSLRAPKSVTRVYDVSDLVAEPARYFFPPMGFGGMGYGGMYGGSMMGPVNGYGGGYGAGSLPGMSYAPRGISGDQGLSNAVGSLSRGTRRSGSRRR